MSLHVVAPSRNRMDLPISLEALAEVAGGGVGGWDHGWLAPASWKDESIGLRGASFLYGGATALLARAGLSNRVAASPWWPLSSWKGAKMEMSVFCTDRGDDS